jgi:hypothetical protein
MWLINFSFLVYYINFPNGETKKIEEKNENINENNSIFKTFYNFLQKYLITIYNHLYFFYIICNIIFNIVVVCILVTTYIFIKEFKEDGHQTILFARIIGFISATLVFIQW